MTLGSISRRVWMAALVAVVAASVAMSVTAVAGAGKDEPEVTAITVCPIHEAQVVRGDDGKDHVEYDLLVVSVVGDPVTLSSVTVLDRGGNELGRIDGDTLTAATQNLFTHAPVPAIPSSGAVAVEVDLALAPGTVPAQVTNRIAYSVPEGTPSAVLLDATEGQVDGPDVEVNRQPAIVIKSPLAGDGWLATIACCGPTPTAISDSPSTVCASKPGKRSPLTGAGSRETGSLKATAARTSSTSASEPMCSRSPTEPWSSSRTASRNKPRARWYSRRSDRRSAATR